MSDLGRTNIHFLIKTFPIRLFQSIFGQDKSYICKWKLILIKIQLFNTQVNPKGKDEIG